METSQHSMLESEVWMLVWRKVLIWNFTSCEFLEVTWRETEAVKKYLTQTQENSEWVFSSRGPNKWYLIPTEYPSFIILFVFLHIKNTMESHLCQKSRAQIHQPACTFNIQERLQAGARVKHTYKHLCISQFAATQSFLPVMQKKDKTLK